MPICFVIQPFDAGMYDKRFADIYKPALEKAGLEVYRVDQDPSVEIPIDSIEEHISKADLCLADISKDNPNVWYELGFAFAVGRPVIMICSENREGKFPFDIQHRSVVKYSSESMSDFKKLEEQISEKASALLANPLSLRRVVESEQIAPTEGLSQHEVLVLALLAGDTAIPDSRTRVSSLQWRTEKAGLTSLGFGLALRKLRKKKFIDTCEIEDEGGFASYTYALLTDSGWKWIEHNEHLFLQHKNRGPRELTSDDDIPF